ncbi:uncharacterized protein LOC142825997 isoform X2 [Pelodiscus sinensis]|uniref:uncharacterized protein LOC142825997 isoform X2 n=1 Tax=Pelodiscus sinensis TaxID=13735 RepID=UPI003F6BE8DE
MKSVRRIRFQISKLSTVPIGGLLCRARSAFHSGHAVGRGHVTGGNSHTQGGTRVFWKRRFAFVVRALTATIVFHFRRKRSPSARREDFATSKEEFGASLPVRKMKSLRRIRFQISKLSTVPIGGFLCRARSAFHSGHAVGRGHVTGGNSHRQGGTRVFWKRRFAFVVRALTATIVFHFRRKRSPSARREDFATSKEEFGASLPVRKMKSLRRIRFQISKLSTVPIGGFLCRARSAFHSGHAVGRGHVTGGNSHRQGGTRVFWKRRFAFVVRALTATIVFHFRRKRSPSARREDFATTGEEFGVSLPVRKMKSVRRIRFQISKLSTVPIGGLLCRARSAFHSGHAVGRGHVTGGNSHTQGGTRVFWKRRFAFVVRALTATIVFHFRRKRSPSARREDFATSKEEFGASLPVRKMKSLRRIRFQISKLSTVPIGGFLCRARSAFHSGHAVGQGHVTGGNSHRQGGTRVFWKRRFAFVVRALTATIVFHFRRKRSPSARREDFATSKEEFGASLPVWKICFQVLKKRSPSARREDFATSKEEFGASLPVRKMKSLRSIRFQISKKRSPSARREDFATSKEEFGASLPVWKICFQVLKLSTALDRGFCFCICISLGACHRGSLPVLDCRDPFPKPRRFVFCRTRLNRDDCFSFL